MSLSPLSAITWVAKGISRCFRPCYGSAEKDAQEGGTGITSGSARCSRLSREQRKVDKMYREVDDYEWGG